MRDVSVAVHCATGPDRSRFQESAGHAAMANSRPDAERLTRLNWRASLQGRRNAVAALTRQGQTSLLLPSPQASWPFLTSSALARTLTLRRGKSLAGRCEQANRVRVRPFQCCGRCGARDVRVTSVHPSISDMMLKRLARRDGPTRDMNIKSAGCAEDKCQQGAAGRKHPV